MLAIYANELSAVVGVRGGAAGGGGGWRGGAVPADEAIDDCEGSRRRCESGSGSRLLRPSLSA